VTCLFTRVGFRRRGVSRALARAAVDFARERGAHALEGYPITTTDVLLEELHVGTEGVFADAGLRVVSRPTVRRVVMRVDF
jgi:GNAT superfamily N-acetyltransferase